MRAINASPDRGLLGNKYFVPRNHCLSSKRSAAGSRINTSKRGKLFSPSTRASTRSRVADWQSVLGAGKWQPAIAAASRAAAEYPIDVTCAHCFFLKFYPLGKKGGVAALCVRHNERMRVKSLRRGMDAGLLLFLFFFRKRRPGLFYVFAKFLRSVRRFIGISLRERLCEFKGEFGRKFVADRFCAFGVTKYWIFQHDNQECRI